MITYELAKELKDAGFPQGNAIHQPYLLPNGPESSLDSVGVFLSGEESNAVYEPTLSELIDACPRILEMGDAYGYDGHLTLTAYADKWHIGYELVDGWYEGEQAEGLTPEEAVARLWLALNK